MKDPSILNNNAKIKTEWFKRNNINDKGAKIKSFDGIYVKTKGAGSTRFSLYEQPGASVMPDGSLVLPDKTIISGGDVEIDITGSVIVKNGRIDLKDTGNVKIIAVDSSVKIGDRTFAPIGEMYIDKAANKVSVTGDGVSVMLKGKPSKSFTGTVEFHNDGHVTLRAVDGKTTSMSINHKLSGLTAVIYEVNKDTDFYDDLTPQQLREYFDKPNKCKNKNCIAIDKTYNHRVSATNNNIIKLNYLESGLPSLKVDTIKDNSKVFFYDMHTQSETGSKRTEFIFSKNPVKYKGSLAKLRVEIVNSWIDNKGVERTFILTHGDIYPDQPTKFKIQMENGKIKAVGSGTSDTDVIRQAEFKARMRRLESFPKKVKALIVLNSDFNQAGDLYVFKRDASGNPIKVNGRYTYRYKNKEYTTTVPPNDVMMKQMFLKMGVPPENIVVKVNVNKQQYLSALKSFSHSNNMKEGDIPYIYTLTHGSRGVQGTSVNYGLSGSDDKEISPQEFANAIKNLNKHHPVLHNDMCYGGGYNNQVRKHLGNLYIMHASGATEETQLSGGTQLMGSIHTSLMYNPQILFTMVDTVSARLKKVIGYKKYFAERVSTIKHLYGEYNKDVYLSLTERRILADNLYRLQQELRASELKGKRYVPPKIATASAVGKYGSISLNVL